jgi:hypothetical protein
MRIQRTLIAYRRYFGVSVGVCTVKVGKRRQKATKGGKGQESTRYQQVCGLILV